MKRLFAFFDKYSFWDNILLQSEVFEYNYIGIKKNINIHLEELCKKIFHPHKVNNLFCKYNYSL